MGYYQFYQRDYNPKIVTNKFAVGECIEWIEHPCKDENNNIGAYFLAGIIKRITPYTVIIRFDNGKETRIDKSWIVQGAADPDLSDAIKASMGINPLNANPKPKIPHDAYRLRDPRDKAVFYVGISKNVQRRFRQHLACSGLNFKLNIRIQDILQSGLIPELELIERAIHGSDKAREREKFWINHHTQEGDQLTNIAEMNEVEQ